MRNLKRALALALSSVMLMGMMVVGTSAKSYPDVTASHDAEAIEVMQAIEVMVGDEKGNFNPDDKVTRAQAAVVIAKLMDMGVIDFNGADLSFTDVPDWAAPFVAACQVEGIVAGYNATTFGSNDTVTAVQYALMVMKTLDYFQFEGDYGDDWVLATAKQAAKIDLFEGLDVSVNAPLTREQVARITLNALQSYIATYAGDGGLTIEGDDFKISTGAVKYYETNKLLKDELFDYDLDLDVVLDDMGRPANNWAYKFEPVGTYAQDADKTVVIDSNDYTSAYDAYQEMVNDDYEKGVAVVYMNGKDTKGTYVPALGDKVEYFMNDDGIITNAAVIRYSVAKIDEIDTEITKAEKEKDATCELTLIDTNDSEKVITALDIEIAGFDAETYVEDAYILYAEFKGEKSDYKVIASEIPATVEGEVTAIKGSKLSIDGELYATDNLGLDIEAKGVFYLGLAGQVKAFEGKEDKSENYGYVYFAKDKASDDNVTNTVTAYMVLADGTYASYVVADKYEDAVMDAYTNGDVIAYNVNSDGELVKVEPADTIADADVTETLVDKNNASMGAYKATSETVFVVYEKGTDKMKVSTVTGYKNVAFENETFDVVYDADTNKVLYAFVEGTNTKASSDIVYAIVEDASAVKTKNADGDIFYTYTVVVDGEEVEITNKDIPLAAMTTAYENDDALVVYYNLDKDGYIDDFGVADTAKVEKVVADEYVVIKIDGVDTQFDLTDADIYTVVTELDADGAVEEIYSKSGATLKAGYDVFYAYDEDGLLILVHNKIAE